MNANRRFEWLLALYLAIDVTMLYFFSEGNLWAFLTPMWLGMAPLTLGFAAFASLPMGTAKETGWMVLSWTVLVIVMAGVLASVATHCSYCGHVFPNLIWPASHIHTHYSP